MEELDIQNARFKQKLLGLESEPPRLGKGSRMQATIMESPQNLSKVETSLHTSQQVHFSSATDNFVNLCGTGDNNSKIRTASSASSITSKSDSSDEQDEDEEQVEVILSEADGMDVCTKEINVNKSSEPAIGPKCHTNGWL